MNGGLSGAILFDMIMYLVDYGIIYLQQFTFDPVLLFLLKVMILMFLIYLQN